MSGFTHSVERIGAPLHAAAHSHHPWPDVTLAAQEQAWRDAARLLDSKWDHVFENVIPAAQQHIAQQLNLSDAGSVAFGPNTHSFVMRLLSCMPSGRPVRILTTSSEFMSFARQIARLEEEALVEVTRVATEPFETFETRFADAAKAGGHDLVFLSHVFFDSGYVVADIAKIVESVPDEKTFVVVDGYHSFMAVPVDFATVAGRAFYLAGGYKYAMAGEGACFLCCPPGYGPRPRDTGWYAGFGALTGSARDVPFASDGSRFLGATFDVSALYRFNAVQDWLLKNDQSVSSMLEHVRELERVFLSQIEKQTSVIDSAMLLVPNAKQRGRFLCFRTADAEAISADLAAKNMIVDHRGDRLRIGFGIYHDENHALRLARALAR